MRCCELALETGKTYILAGRINGTARYFSATTTSTTSASATGSSIVKGNKVLYVGKSDVSEASNAQIGEILYYDRALTDIERDQVIAYLHATWGFSHATPTFLWLDASDGSSITMDESGNVSQWNDKSGLGRHAKVGGNEAPVYDAAITPSESAGIQFDGPDVRLATASVQTSANMTIFVAHRFDNPMNWGSIINQNHDTFFSIRKASCCGANGNLNFHLVNNNEAPFLPITEGKWQLLTAMHAGTTTSMYYTPSEPSMTTQAAIQSGSAPITIGNAMKVQESMGGWIAEIRAFGSALHATDRAVIELQMRNKHGL